MLIRFRTTGPHVFKASFSWFPLYATREDTFFICSLKHQSALCNTHVPWCLQHFQAVVLQMVGQTLLVLYKRSVPRIIGLHQYISCSLKQESHTQSPLFMNVRYANLCTFYLVHLEQVSKFNDCQKNQFRSSNFDQSGQQKTVNEPIRISCINYL